MTSARLATAIASISGAVLKNAAWGLLGEVVIRAAKIAQIVLMARLLGAEELGRFNYLLALAGLFTVFFDFGVQTIAVRELARDRGAPALRLYGRLMLLTSSVGLALIGGYAAFVPMPTPNRYLTFALGLYLALTGFSLYVGVAYRARGEFRRETAWRSVFAGAQFLACTAALLLTRRVEWVAVALVAVSAIGILPLVREWIRQPPVTGEDAGWRGMAKAIRECAPIAATVLVGTVCMSFDVVILGRNVTMAEIGWYSIAVKTVFGLLIMPLHYFQLATLPVFAADPANARSRWLQGFVLSATAGALLNLGTATVAGELVTLIFGAEFSAAAPVLVVYVLIGFLFYLYTPIVQWLVLEGKQRWTLYVESVAVAANVVLVWVLVPRLGVWGAVIAAGITHGMIALGHFFLIGYASGFTGREPGWRSLCRLTVGITLGVCALQFESQWGLISRFIALGIFGICARREVTSLFVHVRAHFYRGGKAAMGSNG